MGTIKSFKMNIENLSLDGKFELFKNMTGRELLSLCSTSKTMRDTCSKQNFYTIWSAKIKEDFDNEYHETDSYQEYLRLAHLYGKTLWTVIKYKYEDQDYDDALIFDSKEKALNYVYEKFKTLWSFTKWGTSSYGVFKSMLHKSRNESGQQIIYVSPDYEEVEGTWVIKPITLSSLKLNYAKEYEDSLNNIVNEIYLGPPGQLKKDFISDLESLLTKRDVEITKFCQKYEILISVDDCSKIIDWVKKENYNEDNEVEIIHSVVINPRMPGLPLPSFPLPGGWGNLPPVLRLPPIPKN